jgi:hypothetical protein
MKPLLHRLSLSLLSTLFLLIFLTLPTTYSTTYTMPDCTSAIVASAFDGEMSGEGFTYAITITLDATTFPSCFHYAFYGFAIYWSDSDSANLAASYYEWEESSGTCTADADLSTIDDSGTEFYTTNDFDPDDDDPCGYTFYLESTSGEIEFELDTNSAYS